MLRIGTTIKRLRTLRGMLQQELADELGTSRNFVSQVENGRRKPSGVIIERVASVFGVPVEAVMWDALDVPDDFSEDDREACELAKQVVANFIERRVPRSA